MAHAQLGLERYDHTLSTTALVHEVYLKLASQRSVQWADRAQIFGLAAQAMRRILIDYARRHRHMRDRVRYDSIDAANAPTDDGSAPAPRAVQLAGTEKADALLALDESLARLAQHDERLCRVVEYRFFVGYTEEETAEALGVTARTVARDWAKAKEWLLRDLTGGAGLS